MTYPDPPVPPPKRRPITETPLVSDSLSALLGGMPAMGQAAKPPKELRRVLAGGGAYYRRAKGEAGDSIVFVGDRPGGTPAGERRLLVHEAGHAFDWRERAPELVRRVLDRFRESKGYAATNEREHFAEAFATGFDAMSHPQQDSATFARVVDALDKMSPGAREVAEYLRGHPLYAGHRQARK